MQYTTDKGFTILSDHEISKISTIDDNKLVYLNTKAYSLDEPLSIISKLFDNRTNKEYPILPPFGNNSIINYCYFGISFKLNRETYNKLSSISYKYFDYITFDNDNIVVDYFQYFTDKENRSKLYGRGISNYRFGVFIKKNNLWFVSRLDLLCKFPLTGEVIKTIGSDIKLVYVDESNHEFNEDIKIFQDAGIKIYTMMEYVKMEK